MKRLVLIWEFLLVICMSFGVCAFEDDSMQFSTRDGDLFPEFQIHQNMFHIMVNSSRMKQSADITAWRFGENGFTSRFGFGNSSAYYYCKGTGYLE